MGPIDLPKPSVDGVRVAFALAGLHRVARGAETAFEAVGRELALRPGFSVTLFGSGRARPGTPYRFVHSPCVPRERFERWPRIPPFRSEYTWEEATFAAQLRSRYDPREVDVSITCGYPFLNWMFRARQRRDGRPRHLFVTQNGDWPAQARNSEYRWFGCDGLICTNPVYFERHRQRYRSWLIPNAVVPERFRDAEPCRAQLDLPSDAKVVAIVSALIPSKRVLEGIRAMAGADGIHLLVVGDGPLRRQVDDEGRALLGLRFRRTVVPFDRMPSVYRSVDALLHMSKDEPFGNVYIEALAAGLPVVAHDWASTRWMFEDAAVLVDTDDAGAVRAGVRHALDLAEPAAVARRLALVQRRFTWAAVAVEYDRCIKAVL